MKKYSGALSLFLCALLVTSPAFALPVARLRNIKPQVQVRSGNAAFAPVRERAALRFGDTIRTDENGKAEVLFSNGTRVAMRAKSQIQIVAPESKDSPLVIRVFGALSEVFVRPKGNTQVKTAAAIAAARGTAFLVRLPDENTTVVTVTEDEVDFSNEQGKVLLAQGQQSTARVGSAPTPPVAVDVSGALAWTAEIAGLPVELETPLQTADANAARASIAPRIAALNAATEPARIVAARLDLGRALYDAGEYSRAEEEFDRVAKAEPQNAEALLGLGAARRARGNISGAFEAYQTALNHQNGSTQARVGLALAQLSAGDFNAATAALQPIQNDAQALTISALIQLRRAQYPAAESTLRSALGSNPNSAQARALLALALLSQNQVPSARVEAQRAVQAQPNSAQTQGTLGMVLFFSGREYSREAARAAERAVALDPLSPFALLVQGRLALADGDIDEARNAFGQAAALAPDLEITHVELAAAYLRQGRVASAEREYRRALAINSNSAAAQSGLAQILARTGEEQKARAAFEAAITQSPENATVRGDYAAFLIEQGKLDEARIQLEAGKLSAPDRGILYARLSEVALMQQRFKEAEQFALKAVGLLPNSALTHYQLGRVYFELERISQALVEFRMAVRLDRDFAEARYALGLTRELVETGRDPSRPAAAAQGGALNSASRLLNLQDLQTPGAEDRIQAALQDPTVVRTASRSYGDTELKAVVGQDGVLNASASHVELSGDRRGVIGLSAQRESFDEIRDRDNSDTTTDRFNIIYGRKANDNPSAFLVMGDYEKLREGLNKGDQLPVLAEARNEAKKPRFIVGGNWQKNSRSRTRALLQYSKPEATLLNPLFGDRQDYDVESLNAEIRHDRRIGREHFLSIGAFAGRREQDVNSFIAGFPPFFPDIVTDLRTQYKVVGGYIRDEYQLSDTLRLIGELKVQKFKNEFSIQSTPAFTPPFSGESDRTELLPTFIADYRPTAQTGVRLRVRRVFGGIRDFQLLSPKDTFLSPLNDLPTIFVTGTGTSVDVEGDHTFRNGSFLRLGIFEARLNDVQEPSSDGSGAVMPRARLRGVRVGYEGNVSQDISFFLNAGYNSARDRDEDEQIANVPRLTSEAGVQFLNEKGWFLQPSIYIQSSRRRPDGTQADSFTTLNLRAGKRFGLRSVVFFEVVNVTDKEFDILNVDQPGRQFRVGVVGRF